MKTLFFLTVSLISIGTRQGTVRKRTLNNLRPFNPRVVQKEVRCRDQLPLVTGDCNWFI
jgi:hypothetical protein